jgi:hypothetical protein
MRRLIVSALMVHAASAIAQDRPSLKDVNAARLANYGAPSKLFHGKQDVKAIVEELEQLRGKKWRQADLRMRCYSTVQLLNGDKLVTAFRLRPELVLERAQDKTVPTYNVPITETDLPLIRKLLTEVPPSKQCD